MARSPLSVDDLVGEFMTLAKSVEHPGLKSLLRTVFGDKALFERFCACPGSQSYHHAYLGGLLEHTVAVADHCAHIAGRYQGVDRDLLVTAALLHDVGKVDELTFETGFGYTDEGRLIGHVVLGVQRIREAAAKRWHRPRPILLRARARDACRITASSSGGHPSGRRRSRPFCCITSTTWMRSPLGSHRCCREQRSPRRSGPTRRTCSAGRCSLRARSRTIDRSARTRTLSTFDSPPDRVELRVGPEVRGYRLESALRRFWRSRVLPACFKEEHPWLSFPASR